MKFKKYIILFTIYFISALIVIYLSLIFKNSKIDNNIFNDGTFYDVTNSNYNKLYNNVINYSGENHNFIIYVVGFSKDVSILEESLAGLINDNGLRGAILYINASKLKSYSIIKQLIVDFGYTGSINYKGNPLLIHFEDDIVTDVIDISNMNAQSLGEVLSSLGVIE